MSGLTVQKVLSVSAGHVALVTYAAKMLTAYYDCTCDSHALFDGMAISGMESYTKHLNRYNVIYLDITSFTSSVQSGGQSLKDVPVLIQEALLKDLGEDGFEIKEGEHVNDCLLRSVRQPDGKPFVFIIDEWDAVIREGKDDTEAQKRYLNLLRGWFKNGNFTPEVVAATYMTGILPVKKGWVTICHFGI